LQKGGAAVQSQTLAPDGWEGFQDATFYMKEIDAIV